ncbi:NADH-quinone oxidoreductase subunit B [Desulfosporosinus sp. SYSU MS00001]|uniref:NADH-quinone oxidoreductase subunit B n=1 Tax=Desulfosporosinus sp. SYSU MS00001 TaxID=3416284 RepID=UPI003CF964A8
MDVKMEKELRDAEALKEKNILLANVDKFLNWGRAHSFWPVSFGLACCAIEMASTGDPRYDISRFGYEYFQASPRNADLMIVAGTLTRKMAPIARRIYDQMAEPKWVIAMGNCACAGGPFTDSYAVMPGADCIIPVDVYIPGCPPRPEALLFGLLQLKQKVQNPTKARLIKHAK